MRQTETALGELMARDLADLDIKVLMLDGEHMAERCVVVALAITADGTKVPVGLWDGSTENKTVVRSLLADLVERGLAFDDGLLVVLDGAKALSAAVREVFGAKALIQRCTLHKRRNIAEHLPDKEQGRGWTPSWSRRSAIPIPSKGCVTRKALPRNWIRTTPARRRRCAKGWRRCSPSPAWASTAASPRPSPPQPDRIDDLDRRTTNRNVTRWRDGQMVLRWTAAGMLNAERSFRRIKGYKQMPQLVDALRRHAAPRHHTESVGAAA